MMNHYIVKLTNRHLVGTGGLVWAETIGEAEELFLKTLAKEEPNLVEKTTANGKSLTYAIKQIIVPEPSCIIMANGEI
jgi:hypothetical protein